MSFFVILLLLSSADFSADAQGTHTESDVCEANAAGSPNCRLKNGASNVAVALGVMTVGGQVSQVDAADFLDTYAEWVSKHGQQPLFDSAHLYQGGNSSSFLGGWLAEDQDREGRAPWVASKANPWGADGWVVGGLSSDRIRQQTVEELHRMNRSKLDVLYLHAPDPSTDFSISIEAVANIVTDGLAGAWGLSNFPAWQVAQAAEMATARGWPLPKVYQGMYNALTRSVEAELFPCLEHYRIPFHAYNVLAGGLLTGKHRTINTLPSEGRFASNPTYQKRYWKASYFDALDGIQQTCEANSIPMAVAATRWLRHHSELAEMALRYQGEVPHALILGASSTAQLRSNLEATDAGPLPKPVKAAFDEAWAATQWAAPCYFWPGSYDACVTKQAVM